MKIEFKEYSNLEDYQFDNGFDLTNKDIEGLKEVEKNELISNQDVVFIKNIDGRLLMISQHKAFCITNEDDNDLKSGLYCIDFDRNGVGDFHDKTFTHNILDENDFGVGLYELLMNPSECNRIHFELKQYGDEKQSESGCSYSSYNVPSNWKEVFKDMTKEEIEKYLKDEWDKEITINIEEYEKEEKEREEERNEKDIVDEKIDNNLPFEILDGQNKIVYDISNNTLTYYKVSNNVERPFLRLKFKSYAYFKEQLGHKLYNVKNVHSPSSAKSYLTDYDISFEYEEYTDDGLGNGQFEYRINVDFENCLFNNIKVAKGKIKFLYNRALSENFDVKYKDSKIVEQLNRLSGIKVDVLDISKIKSGGYDFDITFSLHDRENFKMTFLNQEIIVEWNVIKQYLTSGCSIYTEMDKSKFLKFARELNISNDIIAQQIKKTKILHKLKGDNNGN